MSRADDLFNAVQKVVGDKPLVLLAGASDLVNEKLRELPDALNSLQSEYKDMPMRAAGVLVGQVFRANLKVGQLYDDVTRRGEDAVAKMRGERVVAEEDEPFVHEPFMPVPVHPASPPVVRPAKKAAVIKAPAKKTPVTKKTPVAKKTAAAKNPETSKKSVAKAAAAKKTASARPAARRRPASES
jgi:hypothetical protein